MTCGAYLILNISNGKPYIGASVNIERRWRVHKCELRGNKHCNLKLQRAWNKYGEPSFTFTILEVCERGDIVDCEQRWIDQYDAVNSGYNILNFARSTQGRKFSPEAVERLRQAAKRIWSDPEKRRQLSDRIRVSQNEPSVREAKRERAKAQWEQGNIGR